MQSCSSEEPRTETAANRSFLHSNRRANAASIAAAAAAVATKSQNNVANNCQDRIVYATLDCLALKRTRLPLQLVPPDHDDDVDRRIDDGNITSDKTDSKNDQDDKKSNNSKKTSSRRPSFKIRPGSSLHWKQRHKVTSLAVTGGKVPQQHENTQKESAISGKQNLHQQQQMKNGITNKLPYSCNQNVPKLLPELLQELHKRQHNRVLKQTVEEKREVSKKKDENNGANKDSDDDTTINVIKERELSESEGIKYSRKFSNEECADDKNFDESDEHNEETGYATIKLPKINPLMGKTNQLLISPEEIISANTANLKKMSLRHSKTRSLSRGDLKNITISEPTNFVHLVSATKPKSMKNEESLLVLNHDARYASLPHLYAELGENLKNSKNAERNDIETHEYVRMSPVPARLHPDPLSSVKSKTEFFDRFRSEAQQMKKEPFRRLCVNGVKVVAERAVKVSPQPKNEEHINPAVVKFTDENEAVVDNNDDEDDDKIYECMADFPSKPLPNSSFLWSKQQRMKVPEKSPNLQSTGRSDGDKNDSRKSSDSIEFWEVQKIDNSTNENDDDYEECDEYDHVGPAKLTNDLPLPDQDDDYDHVEPTTALERSSEKVDLEDDVYDDVMPPNTYASIGAQTVKYPSFRSKSDGAHSDDKILEKEKVKLRHSNLETEKAYSIVICNNYLSLDEMATDRDAYDDVELPSQERINSLYGGSSVGFGSPTREESEWEDLEETPPAPLPLPLPQRNGISAKSVGDSQAATPFKKKFGQTWSHKVRRQRSKASRKNSAGSSNQNTHDHTSADSGSDNSNYESLYSSHLDDFSSDSEIEKENASSGKDEIYSEAPSRPTPPPPREASLTQTLGRKMKLLRRTWSLTKGSLGRIRRKIPGENEPIYQEAIPKDSHSIANNVVTNSGDNKKYFSFKKHFRKSVTGLSTFYLDNNENKFTANYVDEDEKPYSNGNWSSGELKNWQDDDSIQSQNSNADRCNLLAEEPLYQFYAAAAARVAFESDSDGYEEVEDLIPTQAATDLARPGHRTLWCQTPQVVNYGLHRLTGEERKLQEAKFEILTSEASYLSSLRVLEEEFVKNFEANTGILTPSEKEKLFGGVPGIRKASERLLADLEIAWTEDPMLHGLPDILLKHARRACNVYVQYCSNQVSIDTTLKELRGRKGSKFLEVLSIIEAHPACHSLSLHSFLMLPMQRVTRLPLLADAVLTKLSSEHPERSSWENVLSSLSSVVAECNEGARAAGRRVEMEALARKLEYASKITPITLRDRHLVRSGRVVQISPKADADYKLTFGKRLNKTPMYLFLLTDYVLVTKPKISSTDETYIVIDTCKRSLITMEAVPEDSPWAGRHAMILTLLENHMGREVEFILACDSDTELMRWLDVITPPKSSHIGETLYESWDCPQVMALYSYAPVQPDELALHPGDVINVLRKMTDGWNHGEKLLDGEQGWFPANYTKEVGSEHVRARNLKQRHRLLVVTGNILQKRGKSNVLY